MTEQDFQQILRKNTYITESRRELFNPLNQMEENRVLHAARESKLPPEKLRSEIQQIVNRLETASFIPLKETKSIGAIAGLKDGRVLPQPLPIEDIRAELDSKFELAVKIYGGETVENFARETNSKAMEILEHLAINPPIIATQDNIFISLPKPILDDQSLMIPITNFMIAAKLRPLANMDVPNVWTDPYSEEFQTA